MHASSADLHVLVCLVAATVICLCNHDVCVRVCLVGEQEELDAAITARAQSEVALRKAKEEVHQSLLLV